MKIHQVDFSNKKLVKEFLNLPFSIYRDIPQWVPPLAGDERRRLDDKKYPFYKHSSAAFFIAREDDHTFGRIAILDSRLYNKHNNEKSAFFYMFECENNTCAADLLFQAAFEWTHKRGLTRVVVCLMCRVTRNGWPRI